MKRFSRLLCSASLVAILSTVGSALFYGEAHAHEGHSHDEATPPPPPLPRGDTPQRLADGSVFLPKKTQRQLALRTTLAEYGEHPTVIELSGKVVLDPGSGGRVQTMNAGRLEAPPGGLPGLGQAVKKGDLLARIQPSVSPLEQGNQSAQLAELRAALGIAEKRLARLRELEATVARKDIEAAESEVHGLRGRLAALRSGLDYHEALHAPVSGIVASANAVAGQVVEARELLFEIIDPDNLRIEALAYSAQAAADINPEVGSAYGISAPGETVRLSLVGAGRALREQAIPLLFSIEASAPEGRPALALNQPVKLIAQTRSRIKGAPLAAAAVVKNAANQEIVWIKTSAERFVARPVRTQALDGTRIVVIDGLNKGERVVTEAAALLNQIR